MKDIQLYDIKNNPNKVNIILTDNCKKFSNTIYILAQGNHFDFDKETKLALKNLVNNIENYIFKGKI